MDQRELQPGDGPIGLICAPTRELSQQACLLLIIIIMKSCLQCFDTVGWAAGRASGLEKTEWWGAGVVICLEQGADLHMAQLMPLLLMVVQ